MTAAELIKKLATMPPDARVWHLWDGALRTEIEHVYLSRDGVVVTADSNAVCYETGDRPPDAPTREEDSCWMTPEAPV